jgi:hypothetical protein
MSDTPRAPWAADAETHRVIGARRWRVSDPRIPADLRQTLVHELMAARRAVRHATDVAAERLARARVHDAKVALGERGSRWWEPEPDPAEVADRIRRAARALGSAVPADALVDAVAAATSTDLAVVEAVLGT